MAFSSQGSPSYANPALFSPSKFFVPIYPSEPNPPFPPLDEDYWLQPPQQVIEAKVTVW